MTENRFLRKLLAWCPKKSLRRSIMLRSAKQTPMGTRRKLVLVASVAVALMIASWAAFNLRPTELKVHAIDYLTGIEIRDPEIARKHNITGYVEITMAPDSPNSLYVKRGGEANITILLHFVSHAPEILNVTQVKIDPRDEVGVGITKVYHTYDEKGNPIERGIVNVNELIDYNVTGIVTIKAGETIPISMSIHIPEDFPILRTVHSNGTYSPDSFPVGAVGIDVEGINECLPVLDDVWARVYVQE